MRDEPGATRAPGSVGELVANLASELPEATAASTAGRVEWFRGRVPFAVVEGPTIEVRLDGPVAAAALRTPDTTASSRGAPWVRFAPGALDGHAVDRATAWFQLAYRRATPT